MSIKIRNITQRNARMAWGNGGVDSDGQPLGATDNEIGLYNELLVKDIESHVIIVLPFSELCTHEKRAYKYAILINKNAF